jgi:hypothetical protein
MRGVKGNAMRKKEREKAFFKLRAQVSSRAAARGQVSTLLLHLLKKGGSKEALRHSRATTILSSSQNSKLADRDRPLCLRSDSSLLSLFLFWNRIFWSNFEVFEGFFLGGSVRRKDFSCSVFCWKFAAFRIGVISCYLCFSV